jgi:hypothetical protein
MISKPFQVYEWEGLSGSQVLSTGEIMQDLEHTEPILHFAMGYVGTWETDLKKRSSIPLNAGASRIKDRYQSPLILKGGGNGASPTQYPME